MSNEESLNRVRQWAAQTLTFAIMVREDALLISRENEKIAQKTRAEVNETAERLWQEAQLASRGNEKALPMYFARFVIRWAGEQIQPSSN